MLLLIYKQEQEGTPEKWWGARKTSKGYRLAEPWPEFPAKISNDFNDLAKDLERTRLTASFVNDFNDLHRTAPLEQISPLHLFFRLRTPLTQKNKGFSNLNFLNDFKDLHTDDLTVVVELDRSSVAVEQAPPNPSSAVVVADL